MHNNSGPLLCSKMTTMIEGTSNSASGGRDSRTSRRERVAWESDADQSPALCHLLHSLLHSARLLLVLCLCSPPSTVIIFLVLSDFGNASSGGAIFNLSVTFLRILALALPASITRRRLAIGHRMYVLSLQILVVILTYTAGTASP